jgi:hypothetical protein
MTPSGWVADYNGRGRWSGEEIVARYRRHCAQLGIPPRNIAGRRTTQGDRTWIYPAMDEVIVGIHQGDRACVLLGIEFIEEDQGFPFGKILKSNTARALRQAAVLDDIQQARLRRRFADMLLRGYLPREYKEYAKLFRDIGLGIHREAIVKADQSNSFIRHWRAYLLQHHTASPGAAPLAHGPAAS